MNSSPGGFNQPKSAEASLGMDASGCDAPWASGAEPGTAPAVRQVIEGKRRAVLAAASNAIEIGDRRRAIEAAIADIDPGDLLVIAGKGHETGQIVGDQRYPFDDAAVAREIAARCWRSQIRRAG